MKMIVTRNRWKKSRPMCVFLDKWGEVNVNNVNWSFIADQENGLRSDQNPSLPELYI